MNGRISSCWTNRRTRRSVRPGRSVWLPQKRRSRRPGQIMRISAATAAEATAAGPRAAAGAVPDRKARRGRKSSSRSGKSLRPRPRAHPNSSRKRNSLPSSRRAPTGSPASPGRLARARSRPSHPVRRGRNRPVPLGRSRPDSRPERTARSSPRRLPLLPPPPAGKLPARRSPPGTVPTAVRPTGPNRRTRPENKKIQNAMQISLHGVFAFMAF